MTYCKLYNQIRQRQGVIHGFGPNIIAPMMYPNMALVSKLHSFPTPCFEVLSDEFPVYDFPFSFIFWVSKLASVAPPMPEIWMTKDHCGACVMPSGTCWWTSPQAVNISALVTEPKFDRQRERKDGDGGVSVLQLHLFHPVRAKEECIFSVKGDTNSLNANYKHTTSLQY